MSFSRFKFPPSLEHSIPLIFWIILTECCADSSLVEKTGKSLLFQREHFAEES